MILLFVFLEEPKENRKPLFFISLHANEVKGL